MSEKNMFGGIYNHIKSFTPEVRAAIRQFKAAFVASKPSQLSSSTVKTVCDFWTYTNVSLNPKTKDSFTFYDSGEIWTYDWSWFNQKPQTLVDISSVCGSWKEVADNYELQLKLIKLLKETK